MHLSRQLVAGAAIVAAPFVLPASRASAQGAPPAPVPLVRRDSTIARRDSIARLGTVTVTAARPDRAAPAGAVHVDAAAIRAVPAQSAYDLLRQAAGLEVHESGQGPGFASDASMRGFSSDHSADLALWIDGVPINEPVNGHAEGYGDWSVLFPAGIHDIDVIRGPSDARFGNFGLAGVVNVHTLERMRGSEITATGGSFGRAEATALTGYDRDGDGGVFGARVAREDGFRPNAGNDVAQLHARAVHDLAPGVTLDGGAELYGGRWRSPGFLGEDDFARHDYTVVSNSSDGGFKRRAQERLSLRVVGAHAVWRTTAYATQGRWQLFLTIPPAGGRLEGSGSQSEEEDRRHGWGATTAITWARARGEVTVGGEAREDRSIYEGFFTTVRARDSAATLVDARQLSGGAFVQAHADVGSRLRLDLGGRYDALATRAAPAGARATDATSATHGVLSPKVGALVHLAPSLGVYANLSRGFRSTDGVIVEPSLAPITAWAYESGLKLDRGGASASAALFRMDVSNEQTFDPITLASSSGGASRRQGLELDWRVPVTAAATLSGGWTFVDARYRSQAAVAEDGGGPPVVLDGRRVYNSARYAVAAAVEIGPPAAWWRLRVAGSWLGAYTPFDEPGTELGAFGLLHASVSARRGRFELTAGVRNLIDRAYPEVVAAHVVAPGQPRAITFSTRARF